MIDEGTDHLLIDVRPKVQFGICSLPNSLHIPIDELDKKLDEVKEAMAEKKVPSNNGMYLKLKKRGKNEN